MSRLGSGVDLWDRFCSVDGAGNVPHARKNLLGSGYWMTRRLTQRTREIEDNRLMTHLLYAAALIQLRTNRPAGDRRQQILPLYQKEVSASNIRRNSRFWH